MRRSNIVLVVLVSFGLFAAACSATSDTATLEATSRLVEQVATLKASLGHSTGETGAIETRLETSAGALEAFSSAAGVHALDRTAGMPDPPDGMVAVRVSFGYLPEPVPGAGLGVYETLPDVSTVWAMESLPAGSELPIGDAISGRTVFLAPGDSVTVAIAYENPTESPVRYMAVPHQDSPGSLNGMIWPQCLCFSFAYEAPAGGSWYRVIQLTASPDIPIGSKVDMLWTMLTDESVFPE